MTNYRNSKLLERSEDVVFELSTALNTEPANNAHQRKDGHRFFVDNSGETAPFDGYHARFNVDFKLQKLADGTNVIADDHNGIVNSTHSFIKKINIKMNGIEVYECDQANHVTNIKNLLEYSQGYSTSQATNEFFYIDMNRHAEERPGNGNYNSGFAARKLLLNGGATVNAEIPLNRYGFFQSLHSELLPNSKIEININLESDTNVAWQATDNCRVVLFKFQLIVPRMIFNEDGNSLYFSKYFISRKWNYLRETVYYSNPSQAQTGTFRISEGVNKPRHVFVFIIDTADETVQTANKFLYKTFSVSTDPRTMTSCYLEVGNGKDYPEVHYNPTTEITRVFRDVLKYVHANSDYAGNTLINRHNYSSIYPILYFDLTKQPADIKDGMTRMVFKYTLSGTTATNYNIYALVLNEQDIEVKKTDNKLVLRSM